MSDTVKTPQGSFESRHPLNKFAGLASIAAITAALFGLSRCNDNTEEPKAKPAPAALKTQEQVNQEFINSTNSYVKRKVDEFVAAKGEEYKEIKDKAFLRGKMDPVLAKHSENVNYQYNRLTSALTAVKAALEGQDLPENFVVKLKEKVGILEYRVEEWLKIDGREQYLNRERVNPAVFEVIEIENIRVMTPQTNLVTPRGNLSASAGLNR